MASTSDVSPPLQAEPERSIPWNGLLEGAILLAIDCLLQGQPVLALNVLLAARTSMRMYLRRDAQNDVEALRRMALAASGEWP